MSLNSHLNDESSQEQKNNKSDDEMNVNCLSYIQTKQRRIDHRRNKSEPLIRSNLDEDEQDENLSLINLQSSSTSTTSNESALSHSSSQNQTNSSIKSPSNQLKQKSSSTTKKKKSWLSVSYSSFQRFIKHSFFFLLLHMNTFRSRRIFT